MSKRSPASIALALGSGIVFGFGLAVSRMIDPTKVHDFLDFTAIGSGGWDPSLAVVMAVAVVVTALFYWVAGARQAPLLASAFSLPKRASIDARLITGSAIFGAGWGISGLCPAPAIVNVALTPAAAVVFVAAMAIGSWTAGAATGGLGARMPRRAATA